MMEPRAFAGDNKSNSEPTSAHGCAPIALFVYNRPSHTRKTVTALQRSPLAASSDLHIFSDAAKHPGAAEAVREVREFVAKIWGFRSVKLVERGQNFGLSKSIIEGVTRLCEQYGRVIVLEDDLVTSKHFLEYMNSGLVRYAEDDKVMQIAGYMFPMPQELPEEALLLPFISSWGWATWARAWKYFDPDAECYEQLRRDHAMRKRFDLDGNYGYFKMLKAQQSGKVDSWAIRWYLSVFMRNGLALYPRRTLVQNAGFDGSGVNCAVSSLDQDGLDSSFRVTTMPNSIAESKSADFVMRNMPRPKRSIGSIANRLLNNLRRR